MSKFDPLNPIDESKLYCPHCGAEQLNNEDEGHDIEMGLDVCEACEKEFWMSRRVTFKYDSWIEEEKERKEKRVININL